MSTEAYHRNNSGSRRPYTIPATLLGTVPGILGSRAAVYALPTIQFPPNTTLLLSRQAPVWEVYPEGTIRFEHRPNSNGYRNRDMPANGVLVGEAVLWSQTGVRRYNFPVNINYLTPPHRPAYEVQQVRQSRFSAPTPTPRPPPVIRVTPLRGSLAVEQPPRPLPEPYRIAMIPQAPQLPVYRANREIVAPQPPNLYLPRVGRLEGRLNTVERLRNAPPVPPPRNILELRERERRLQRRLPVLFRPPTAPLAPQLPPLRRTALRRPVNNRLIADLPPSIPLKSQLILVLLGSTERLSRPEWTQIELIRKLLRKARRTTVLRPEAPTSHRMGAVRRYRKAGWGLIGYSLNREGLYIQRKLGRLSDLLDDQEVRYFYSRWLGIIFYQAKQRWIRAGGLRNRLRNDVPADHNHFRRPGEEEGIRNGLYPQINFSRATDNGERRQYEPTNAWKSPKILKEMTEEDIADLILDLLEPTVDEYESDAFATTGHLFLNLTNTYSFLVPTDQWDAATVEGAAGKLKTGTHTYSLTYRSAPTDRREEYVTKPYLVAHSHPGAHGLCLVTAYCYASTSNAKFAVKKRNELMQHLVSKKLSDAKPDKMTLVLCDAIEEFLGITLPVIDVHSGFMIRKANQKLTRPYGSTAAIGYDSVADHFLNVTTVDKTVLEDYLMRAQKEGKYTEAQITEFGLDISTKRIGTANFKVVNENKLKIVADTKKELEELNSKIEREIYSLQHEVDRLNERIDKEFETKPQSIQLRRIDKEELEAIPDRAAMFIPTFSLDPSATAIHNERKRVYADREQQHLRASEARWSSWKSEYVPSPEVIQWRAERDVLLSQIEKLQEDLKREKDELETKKKVQLEKIGAYTLPSKSSRIAAVLSYDLETVTNEDGCVAYNVTAYKTDLNLDTMPLTVNDALALKGQPMEVIYCKTFAPSGEYNALSEFANWLGSSEATKYLFTLEAFNGSRFDHLLLVDELSKINAIVSDSLIMANNSIIAGETVHGHKFHDISRFVNGSLAKCCESFGNIRKKVEGFSHSKFQNAYLEGGRKALEEYTGADRSETTLRAVYEKGRNAGLQKCITDNEELITQYAFGDSFCNAELCSRVDSAFISISEQIAPTSEVRERIEAIDLELKKYKGASANDKRRMTRTGESKAEDRGALEEERKRLMKRVKPLSVFDCNTIASWSMKLFLRHLDRVNLQLPESPRTAEDWEWTRKAFYGGRTQNMAGKPDSLPQMLMVMIDICSSYPNVMTKKKFPIGKAVKTPCEVRGKLGIYNVHIIKQPALVIIPRRTVALPLDWTYTGEQQVVICSNDIKQIRKYGGEVIVGGGIYWEESSKDLFRGYLEPIFELKSKLDALAKTAEANPALREACKLAMNALSGKLGERVRFVVARMCCRPVDTMGAMDLLKNEERVSAVGTVDGSVYVKAHIKNPEAREEFYQDNIDRIASTYPAVFLLSYARANLYLALTYCGDFGYCDTDSALMRVEDWVLMVIDHPNLFTRAAIEKAMKYMKPIQLALFKLRNPILPEPGPKRLGQWDFDMEPKMCEPYRVAAKEYAIFAPGYGKVRGKGVGIRDRLLRDEDVRELMLKEGESEFDNDQRRLKWYDEHPDRAFVVDQEKELAAALKTHKERLAALDRTERPTDRREGREEGGAEATEKERHSQALVAIKDIEFANAKERYQKAVSGKPTYWLCMQVKRSTGLQFGAKFVFRIKRVAAPGCSIHDARLTEEINAKRAGAAMRKSLLD